MKTFKLLALGLTLLAAPVISQADGIFGGGSAGNINYRKPNLEWLGISSVTVENNTDTADQTKIVFPDGTSRSVTEASGTKKYRFLDLAQAAVYTSCGSGAEASGLFSGLTESTGTWYAVYAVKSQCTSGASNFVLVAASHTFTRANITPLNTNFGTSGWSYLGLIRNGNNDLDATASHLVDFRQSGNFTVIRATHNAATQSAPSEFGYGVIIASAAGAPTWSYTAGMGQFAIPDTVSQLQYFASCNTCNIFTAYPAANTLTRYWYENITGVPHYRSNPFLPASLGIQIATSGNSGPVRIAIQGFIDNALGGNTTP